MTIAEAERYLQTLITSGEVFLWHPLGEYSDAFIQRLAVECQRAKVKGGSHHRILVIEPHGHSLTDSTDHMEWRDTRGPP